MAKAEFFYEEDDRPAREAPTFDLYGKSTETGMQVGPFSFTCFEQPDEIALIDIMGAAYEEDFILASARMIEFIRRSLPDKERTRFNALLRRRDVEFNTKVFGQIWTYLVEEYGQRPKAPSSDSSPGPTPTAHTSTGAAFGSPVVAPSP